MKRNPMRARVVTLRSFVELPQLPDGVLPAEFRLFKAGLNDTENGQFLFDEKAARAVMAAYKAWGVDLAIDLEHNMLDDRPQPDPTAKDARGWCKLEVRNGELWACDVRWTPDGAARLNSKTQRYVSPAFDADAKTKRVLKMINVAITSIPATHNTPALVAASATETRTMTTKKLGTMARDEVEAALEALESGDDAKAMEILKSMIASAASGDGDEAGSEGNGAEGLAPTSEGEQRESVEDPKVVANKDPEAMGDDEEDDDKPEKKAARKALSRMLCRLTGKKTFAEAVVEVETFRASHLTLESERQKLASERATLEAAERRQLVTTLIKLGAEFPGTVWADDKATTIKPRWLKMPIESLRAHVADQRAARGDKAPSIPSPAPERDGSTQLARSEMVSNATVKLSAEQLQYAKEAGVDPKEYARLLALRDGKR